MKSAEESARWFCWPGQFSKTQRLMLLDEPTSHLDLKNQVKIMDLVRSVAVDRGITTIMDLHDPNLALHYCDDVVFVEGRLHYGYGRKKSSAV